MVLLFPITSLLQDELRNRTARQRLFYLIPVSTQGKMVSVLCKQGIPSRSLQRWWRAVSECPSTLNVDLRASSFTLRGADPAPPLIAEGPMIPSTVVNCLMQWQMSCSLESLLLTRVAHESIMFPCPRWGILQCILKM